jgi:hypothetical protein
MIDERRDLPFEIARQEVIFQQDAGLDEHVIPLACVRFSGAMRALMSS